MDPRVAVELQERGEEAELTVSDNGGGMREKELDRVLSDTYSSKELGTGLGLIIVRRIMELHRGSMEIVSGPDRGTRVRLRFHTHV